MIDRYNNRRGDFKGFRMGFFRNLISIPFIYSMIIPALVLDLFVIVYQAICFPLYGIKKIERSRYIHFHRGDLGPLSLLDRAHCHYCAYVNGVFAYAQKIAGETERIWCPIRHLVRNGEKFVPPPHQKDFVPAEKKELEQYYADYEKKSSDHQQK